MSNIDIGRILIDENTEEKKNTRFPKGLSKKQIIGKSTEVMVSQNKIKETSVKPYPKDLHVGRIVIDEIQEEKQDISKEARNRQNTTEIASTQQAIEETLCRKKYAKDINVGRFVIDEHPEDISEIKKREESRKKGVLLKRTVPTLTELERKETLLIPKYHNVVDVTGNVIEEIPEGIKEIPDRDIVKKKPLQKNISELTITKTHVAKRHKKYVMEDVAKVGKLDTSDLNHVTQESRHAEKRLTTQKESIDNKKVI